MFIVPTARLCFHTAVVFCAAGTVYKGGGVGAEAAALAASPLSERVLWKGVCIFCLACKKCPK